MGSKSDTTSSNNSNSNYSSSGSTAPGWAPQEAALTNAFNQSGSALTKAQGYTAPTGTAADLSGNGALSANGVNLSNNGTNAAVSGLGALSGFNAADANNPQAILDAAHKYADGQDIDAQVRNAMLNATQTARDVTLPGINQHAAITGNSDSSRAGIAEGLVRRGLAEQSADLGASLRNDAFKTGLSLAQMQANNNNGLNLNAANAAAGQGNSAANTGQNVFSGALNNTGTANNINQSNYGNDVNNAYAALQKYMGLIGSNNWGMKTASNGTSSTSGTGTQSTQNDPGILSNISSGMGLLAAFL